MRNFEIYNINLISEKPPLVKIKHKRHLHLTLDIDPM